VSPNHLIYFESVHQRANLRSRSALEAAQRNASTLSMVASKSFASRLFRLTQAHTGHDDHASRPVVALETL
jgi:hypothetical protein